MGFRFLMLACKRVLVGMGALWLLVLPMNPIRPQMTSAQFQEIQRQQQQALQNEWSTSHWDLGQNIRLDAMEGHLTATDTRAEVLRVSHEALAREVSEAHGEETVWFGIIGAVLVALIGAVMSNYLKIRDAAAKR